MSRPVSPRGVVAVAASRSMRAWRWRRRREAGCVATSSPVGTRGGDHRWRRRREAGCVAGPHALIIKRGALCDGTTHEDERVSAAFSHTPVLVNEVVELARRAAPGLIVDCTVGGGGHAAALLRAFPGATLLGMDRDPEALAAAAAALREFGDRARLVRRSFAELQAVVTEQQLGPASVVLADFGVSSHQLASAERGFSFARPGPLDMRMDPSQATTAASLVERLDESELTEMIRTLGEERHARRVARAIVSKRPTTTDALAELVRAVVPSGRDRIDPATRTFQALRMAVNRELEQVQAWLQALPVVLHAGGVGIAISFHSLEDRAVKRAFRAAAAACVCPPRMPVCRCGHTATLAVLTAKPRRASAAESQSNPRARSAKLRAAERLGR